MADLSSELQAMAAIEAALKDLQEDERARVMQWAAARFRGAGKGGPSEGRRVEDGEDQERAGDGLGGEHATLAELYDAANPQTDANRALVAAYWFQYRQGAADIEAQAINSDLKHLGHGVGNITRAFDALKGQKPALIIQTRKEGSSKQARKRYRVTGEGKKAVDRMISGDSE